jgi:hypothetical protein
MINYFKYTSGNAFTLSGVDYSGFVNIDDNKPFTGRVKNSFSVELSSKGNFLARSIIEKREFDNSPSTNTTNKLKSLEYSPRNILSNDFLKKNFNILYENNLSLFSLGQVYNNSYLDFTNFKDESSLGGFFGLSSTTIDIRNDDRSTLKDLNTPYQIDPFKGADKNIFPDLFELDNTKRSYVETYEDGFLYTITTDSRTIAFSGNFNGQLETIKNPTTQKELAKLRNLYVDRANGLIYSPKVFKDGLTYTNIYDRNIFRACARLKLVDRVKTSDFKVINNNISFGKTYKVVQVIDDELKVNLEISKNNTSEVIATLPISSLDNPEYVKVTARYTDDLLLIVTKPISNTQSYNVYLIDIPEFISNGEIPEPEVINRVILNTNNKSNTGKDAAFTVFGTPSEKSSQLLSVEQKEGYYYPLFENKFAVREFSLAEPREIFMLVRDPITNELTKEGPFYIADKFLVRNEGAENRPDGFFIYRDDNSLIDLDIKFSDYDSNLFTIKDNGNLTERLITNPGPITSFVDTNDLLLPPDIKFDSLYKFNTNNWKFNTNKLESNRISFINTLVDTFKDKTYSYYHNVGRLCFSSGSLNKKRISLVPADLQSFFNPDIFDTVCESSLGVNLNVLIQDILRDTINIYNNFTRIPKAGEIKSLKRGAVVQNLNQGQGQLVELGSVTSRVETGQWEPLTKEGLKQTQISWDLGSKITRTEEYETQRRIPDLSPYLGHVTGWYPKPNGVTIKEELRRAKAKWEADPNRKYHNAVLPTGTKTRTVTEYAGPFTMRLSPVKEFHLLVVRNCEGETVPISNKPGVEIIGLPDPYFFPELFTEEEVEAYKNDPEYALRFADRETFNTDAANLGYSGDAFSDLFGTGPAGPREVEYSGIYDSVKIEAPGRGQNIFGENAYKEYLRIKDLPKEQQIEEYYNLVGRKGTERYYIIVEDPRGRTSRQEVTFCEYQEFQKMSSAEQMNKYYDVDAIFNCENANVRWKKGVDENNLPEGADLYQLIEVSEGTISNIIPSQYVNDYDGEIQTFTVIVDTPAGYFDGFESISCELQGTNNREFSTSVFNDYKIPLPLEIDTRNFYFHSNESVNYLSVNRVFSKLFELQKTIYDSILSS